MAAPQDLTSHYKLEQVLSWTGVARLVRGEFFRQKNIEYVMAAEALGYSKRRIIFGHILKNALAPVLVSATFGVAGAILCGPVRMVWGARGRCARGRARAATRPTRPPPR